MDAVSPLITQISLESLPISTPTPTLPSSKSNTTTQEQPDITNTPTGDIPPPHFTTSINELRSFSTALSAFLSRYDELHNHLNFINSSVHTTNPNQSPLTHLLTTCSHQTITAFPELIVSDQNPKDCERSHAIATTPENTNCSHNSQETADFIIKKTITAVPEGIVSGQNPNRMAYNGKQSHENDISKKPEETSCDRTVAAVPETIVSEQNPNFDVLNKPEELDILNKHEELDALMIQEEIDLNGMATDCKQSQENVRTLESVEEVDVSVPNKPGEIDILKNHEETGILKKAKEPEASKKSVVSVSKKPEQIVSEQKPNQMAANGEQRHENVRTPECLEEIDVCENPEEIAIIPEEIDTLKKPEESLPETSFDHTTTTVPEAIVSEQNPNGNVRKAESLEEIDVSVSKKPKQTDILNTPEESNICKNPEETVVLKKPKIINTLKKHEENGTLKKAKGTESNICKNPEETVVLKKPKSINTLKRREENGTLKKAKETEASKQSVVSELECLCRSMSSKQMKRHVATHFSEMINLRDEIAKTFKLAEDPAKLVLYSVGRFFVQGSRTFRNPHQNKANLARMAAVLILECFVMIISDGIEIAKRDREYAAEAAVDWRKRMIKEGGLRLTDEVDARGLLLLISGFGIQDHVFTIQDIIDLIRASNVKGISAALRRSVFLIPKIPEVIYLMAKSNMEIEAVDIAYTFGLEDMCHPQNILTTYLHNKIKDIQNASPLQMLEAVKQHLVDLKSVKQCLESHNVDPSTLLPDFNINEKIQNLEKEVTEWKLIQKRKFLGNSNHQEAKRACFGHENMPRLQKPVDHYGMNRFNQPTTQPSTVYFDSNRNLGNSYITSRSASPAYNASAVPENMPGSVPNGLAGGLPGSYDRTVHTANVQPYVWHGSYDQHYSRYGQTYDSQPNHRPWGQGLPESFPGLPGRQGPSSNLYSFADIVENETRGGSRGA